MDAPAANASADADALARWDRLKSLFADADACPPADQSAFLDASCPDDPDLRADVEALLAVDADGALGAFDRMGTGARALAEQAAGTEPDGLPEAGPSDAAPEPPYVHVGPYRLVREVGRGGMGTVFEATRDDGQYVQRVALKLIRGGAASADVQRRFRAERQTLARLEHVGIARLLDGGQTPPAPDAPDGLPYLVMELVDGAPVTAFADARGLGVEARLGLFVQVCEAVAYAHRHLVVHRDLKPANVLVTDTDSEPQVKLLDFGIARLLDDGADTQTATGARRLTPAYAAPEQLAGRPATTAADVYALGVLLYELLVGRPPERFTAGASGVGTGATGAVVRPSAVLAQTGGDRRAKRLRGDLDTVVMTALRDEPERRYATAAEMADDVRRHLAHEPVRARPDTLGYRASRFVRRHRAGVAAAAVVALAVVGGAGAALWQAGVARAEARQARLEEAKATATLDFLQNTLYGAEPGTASPDATIREALDSAAVRIDRDLADQPLVAAGLHSTVGLTYFGLGLADRAVPHQRRAVALYATAGLRYRLEEGIERNNLAQSLDALGRSAEALPHFERALALQRAAGTPADVGSVLNGYAVCLDALGRTGEAERRYREAIALLRRARAPALPLALNNLAVLYEATRRPREAVPLVEEAVRALRARGPEAEPELGPALATLGALYDYTGRSAEGAAALDSALVLLRRRSGPDHPLTLLNTASRAFVSVRAGRPREALPLARTAYAGVRRTLTADHPYTPHALAIYAEALCAVDSARAGERLAREALATRRALYPPDHFLVAITESVHGACLSALGRRGEAEPLLRHGLATLRAARGDADARTADARRRLAAFERAARR